MSIEAPAIQSLVLQEAVNSNIIYLRSGSGIGLFLFVFTMLPRKPGGGFNYFAGRISVMLKTVLMVVMIIVSIVLTASILFQSGNSAGLSGSIGGGAEQLFGKKKSSGYEGILSKITTVCAVIFFITAVAMTALQQ